MEADVRRIKQVIAGGPKGTSRRYTGKLREDIVALTRAMRAQGKPWSAISSALGVGQETLQRLCGSVADHGGRSKGASFVPVVIRDDPKVHAKTLTFVSPRGYRIEGLDVAAALELLGRLP
jgi:hypothetical protein